MKSNPAVWIILLVMMLPVIVGAVYFIQSTLLLLYELQSLIETPIIHRIETVKVERTVEHTQHIEITLEPGNFKILTVEATAYAPLDPRAIPGVCHDGDPTSTFTGTYPSLGTIAVDPSVIPLGSVLMIPYYGLGIAEDIGGAIKGNKIDLFFEDRDEALDWGRKTLRVLIIEPEEGQ